jgi:hypothetical protein
MPLGFFGTAISLIALAIAIPFVYAMVWPGGVSRMAVFLSITTVVGIVAGVAAFLWLVVPLKGIGIAATPAGAADESATFSSMLLSRFYIAVVALAILQAALSKGLQHFLFRGGS